MRRKGGGGGNQTLILVIFNDMLVLKVNSNTNKILVIDISISDTFVYIRKLNF